MSVGEAFRPKRDIYHAQTCIWINILYLEPAPDASASTQSYFRHAVLSPEERIRKKVDHNASFGEIEVMTVTGCLDFKHKNLLPVDLELQFDVAEFFRSALAGSSSSAALCEHEHVTPISMSRLVRAPTLVASLTASTTLLQWLDGPRSINLKGAAGNRMRGGFSYVN